MNSIKKVLTTERYEEVCYLQHEDRKINAIIPLEDYLTLAERTMLREVEMTTGDKITNWILFGNKKQMHFPNGYKGKSL